MKLANLFSTGLLLQGSCGHDAMWRKVDLAETKLTATSYQEEIQAKHVFQCQTSCYYLAWCLLTCWKELEGICILSNAIVSGNYREDVIGVNILSCYTKKVSNLVVGKSVEVDSIKVSRPDRDSCNLVDGFYNYDVAQCWLTAQYEIHWAKVDLETPTYISEVVFFCQAVGDVARLCRDITVKVGLSPDPNTMTTFGKLDGPGTLNQSVISTTKTPLRARYIYLEKALDDQPVQICHLEVQGKLFK